MMIESLLKISLGGLAGLAAVASATCQFVTPMSKVNHLLKSPEGWFGRYGNRAVTILLILSLLSIVSLGFLHLSAKAAALTSVSFGGAGGCTSGASCTSTYWQINFTTTEMIPNDGKVKITFPAGFNVSSASFNNWSGIDGTRTVSVDGQTVIVTRSGDGTASTAGAKWIRLSNVVNPPDGGTYTGTVETAENGDTTLDGPTTSSNLTIYEIDSISVIPSTLKTDEETTYKINFRHARSIPNSGKIKITFPAALDISNASFNTWSGIDGGQSLAIDGDTVVITRDGTGTSTTYGSRSITLDGIKHPAEEIEIVIEMETTQSDDTSIDEGIQSYTLGTSIDPDDTWQWSTYAGDNRRSNRSLVAGPVYGTVVRIVSVEGNITNTLLGKHNEDIILTYDGKVLKYNDTGELIWEYIPSALTGNHDGDGYFTFGAISSDETLHIVTTSSSAQNRIIGVNVDGTEKYNVLVGHHGGHSAPLLWGGNKGYLITNLHGGTSGTRLYSMNDGRYVNAYYTGAWTIGYATGLAMYDNIIYMNRSSSVIQAIGVDGSQKWSTATGLDMGFNRPVISVDGNTLYIGQRSGKIYAFDSENGTMKWEFNVPTQGMSNNEIRTDIAVSDNGNIYLFDNRGNIYGLKDEQSTYSNLWTYSAEGTASVWIGNTIILSDLNNILYVPGRSFQHGLVAVDVINGTRKWVYRNLSQDNQIGGGSIDSNGHLRVTSTSGFVESHVIHFAEWTLSAEPLAEYYKAGDTITISATSNMLKRDPLASVDNQVQAVLSNGDKVALAYHSTSGSNNVWKGTYVVPKGTESGALTVEIQAAAYMMTTDISTSFDSLPPGFDNTGMTFTVSTKLDNTKPASSSKAVQITVDGKTYDKYFVPLSIPDLSSVGNNQHPQFCFSKAYDAPDGSGIASYTVRVDGRDYLRYIPYNAPAIDGNRTRKDGNHAIIKETDEYWYRYSNHDRPAETQKICVYGKGDAKKLHPGLHTWSVRVDDKVGNRSETKTRRFLVGTNSGSFVSAGAGWGSEPNLHYRPGFSQGQWFPLAIMQIGNRSFTNEVSTLNPVGFSSEQPIQISTENPTIYGLAESGSRIKLTIDREYYDAATQHTQRERVIELATSANEFSEWGINLTKDTASLATRSEEKATLYIATVMAEKEDRFAIIKDIPLQVVTRPATAVATVLPRTTMVENQGGEAVPTARPSQSNTPSPLPLSIPSAPTTESLQSDTSQDPPQAGIRSEESDTATQQSKKGILQRIFDFFSRLFR